MVTAIYTLLLGFATLSSSVVRSIFGYEVRDPGVLFVLSAAFFGLGVVVWGISANAQQYGGLATSVVIALVIFIVWLLWGWLRGTYTARNVVLPLIIDIVLAIWIWSAKPKA